MKQLKITKFKIYVIFLIDIFLLILTNIANFGILLSLDYILNSYLKHFFSQSLISFFKFITFFGSGTFILIATSLLILQSVRKKNLKNAFFLSSVIFFGGTIIYLLKFIIKRVRPENSFGLTPTSFSFPSGHTAMATIFFLTIIFLYKDKFEIKRNKNLFIGISLSMILLVAISRLALGVHWFSDVLGGIIIGGIIFTMSWHFYKLTK